MPNGSQDWYEHFIHLAKENAEVHYSSNMLQLNKSLKPQDGVSFLLIRPIIQCHIETLTMNPYFYYTP